LSYEHFEEAIKDLIVPHIRLKTSLVDNEITTDSHIGFMPAIKNEEDWALCTKCGNRTNFFAQVSKPYGQVLHSVLIFFCDCEVDPTFYFRKLNLSDERPNMSIDKIRDEISPEEEFPLIKLELDVSWNAPCLGSLKAISKEVSDKVINISKEINRKNNTKIAPSEYYNNFRYSFDLMALNGTDTIMGYPEGFHLKRKTVCNDCGSEFRLFLQFNEETLKETPLLSLKNLMIFECNCASGEFKAVFFS